MNDEIIDIQPAELIICPICKEWTEAEEPCCE